MTKAYRTDMKKPGKQRQRKQVSFPTDAKTFTVKLFKHADQRVSIVRHIQKRVKLLQQDCTANTEQKRILVDRAAFLATVCETHECTVAQGGAGCFDVAGYVQAVNSLSALLLRLGLDKTEKEARRLQGYIKGKQKDIRKRKRNLDRQEE